MTFARFTLVCTLLFGLGCGEGAFDTGTAELEVVSHEQQGRLVRIDLEYAGGCVEHDFRVCWAGIAGASDPPLIPLEINHYDNGDTCKAIVSKSLWIDMSEVEGFSANGARIGLHLPLDGGGTRGLYNLDYGSSEEPIGSSPEAPYIIDLSCGTIDG